MSKLVNLVILISSIVAISYSFEAIFYFFTIKSSSEHFFYMLWFSLLTLMYYMLPSDYKYFSENIKK